ncbi:MAG: DRTGG domain-containing protein [Candidatus Enterenecus sp.]
MRLREVRDILNAEVLCGQELLDTEVLSACGSDFMSDVLAYVKNQAVLLTGLVNPQVVRTADMMDMKCIVFVRGKRPDGEMLELARERGMVVMASDLPMYPACGELYLHGLRGSGR